MAFRLEGYHQGEWGSETGKVLMQVFHFKSNNYLCYFLGLILIAFRQWLPKQKEQESLKEACLLVPLLSGWCVCMRSLDWQESSALHGQSFLWPGFGAEFQLVVVCCLRSREVYSLSVLVAAACGLQNAMCTSHFGAIIRTTHLTGTVTDIGSTLGRISMIYLRKGCRRSRLDHVERAEVGVDASCSECKVVQVVL